MDHVTTATAGAAMTSPWWLHTLQASHDGVAFLLPFMGFAWFAMQMYYKWKEKRSNGSRPL